MNNRLYITVTDNFSHKPYIDWEVSDHEAKAKLVVPKRIIGYVIYPPINGLKWEIYSDDGLGNGDSVGTYYTLQEALLKVYDLVHDVMTKE